ncbi:MAG: gliding motility-associated C-terminal domain-containing protein [Bacteroidia bacterium]|nr:gliding motility-associated C-terminal domain-containing protein [Bacteroidia bacterium]
MRKFVLLIFIAVSVSVKLFGAEFSISGTDAVGTESTIDTIFVVNGTQNGVLHFQMPESHDYNWYKYDIDGTSSLIKSETNVTETSVDLEDEKSIGYKLDISGNKSAWVWVFDYKRYQLLLDTIIVNGEVEDRCSYIQLNINMDVEPMEYDTIGQITMHDEVERLFELSYDSTYYNKGSGYVSEKVTRVIPEISDYTIESPLGDTQYSLTGDQFAKVFEAEPPVMVSELFKAIAIEIHLDATVRIRENATNENERGDPVEPDETKTLLKGSAPLNIEIINNASPAAFFYTWCLSNDREFEDCIIQTTDKDFRYTFKEKATYYLRVQVSNSSVTEDPEIGCTKEATYTIEVLESALDIPNIFTPNGDGKNDEFRVAYKSIIKFNASVYNIWGKLVYQWDDPATGWNGTIGGKPAAEGAYMYIIEATGDDMDDEGNRVMYYKKGTVNLIR